MKDKRVSSRKDRKTSVTSDIKKSPPKESPFLWILPVGLVILIFLITYVFIFDNKVDLNGDNASYYSLGKALATGEGYVTLADIDKPPQNHYPPGYPAIISMILLVFGHSIFMVKVFNGLFILASILLIYQISLKITGNKMVSFVVSMLLVFNTHLLLYGTIMMSEAPFTLLSLLTLFLVLGIREEKIVFLQPGFYISLVTLGASYYIRSTGLALLGGILLFFLVKKNGWALVGYSLGFVMQALPWFLRGRQLGGSSYIRPLVMINPYRPDLGHAGWSDYVSRVTSNISRYITREIPSSSFSFMDVNYTQPVRLTEWIVGLILAVLIVYGLSRLKKFRILVAAYLAATFGILFLWPEVWTGVRFILPVTPLLFLLLIYGLIELFSALAEKMKIRLTLSPLFLLILILFYIKPVKALHKRAVDEYPANWKNYFELARFMKKQEMDSAVVCCRKADLFHLFSETFTYTYPYIEDDQELLRQLKENRVTHVVLDNLGYRQTYAYLLPAVQKNPEHFEVVQKISNPDTYLLKFKP